MGWQLAEGMELEDENTLKVDPIVFRRMREAGLLERIPGTSCWRLSGNATEVLQEGLRGRKSR
jgi:hypothetical protein